MKLRLDEYYYIIKEEWEDIESYMPEDMRFGYLAWGIKPKKD